MRERERGGTNYKPNKFEREYSFNEECDFSSERKKNVMVIIYSTSYNKYRSLSQPLHDL